MEILLIIIAVAGCMLFSGIAVGRRVGHRFPPPECNPTVVPSTRHRGYGLDDDQEEICELCGEIDPYAPGKFALCPVGTTHIHQTTIRRRQPHGH